MKPMKISNFLCSLIVSLLFFTGSVSGQEASEALEAEAIPEVETSLEAAKIDVEGASFQQILEQLFGTLEVEGLLSSNKPFVLHGQAITLTPEEAQNFFSPVSPNEMDFASLVAAFEDSKRGNIHLEGLIDSTPFQLAIAGRQLKLEGISMTQEEFNALVAELQDVPGLHQAKIEATVDGELVSVNMQNVPGQVRIHTGTSALESEALKESGAETQGHRSNQPERIEAARNNRGPERVERPEMPERPEKAERPEKVERPEKMERIERIDRIERPDLERPGVGRN